MDRYSVNFTQAAYSVEGQADFSTRVILRAMPAFRWIPDVFLVFSGNVRSTPESGHFRVLAKSQSTAYLYELGLFENGSGLVI